MMNLIQELYIQTIVQEFLKHITMFIMMYISETHIQTRIGTGAIITV